MPGHPRDAPTPLAPEPRARLGVRFTGRVQGVGFRATARDCCRPRPVTGLVRNEPDGSVWLEIQGASSAIDDALAQLRARMRHLITHEASSTLELVADEPAFEIRR